MIRLGVPQQREGQRTLADAGQALRAPFKAFRSDVAEGAESAQSSAYTWANCHDAGESDDSLMGFRVREQPKPPKFCWRGIGVLTHKTAKFDAGQEGFAEFFLRQQMGLEVNHLGAIDASTPSLELFAQFGEHRPNRPATKPGTIWHSPSNPHRALRSRPRAHMNRCSPAFSPPRIT